jgi:hypothetical protein
MTRESFRLSMIVLTNAMRKKRADMGMNLRAGRGGQAGSGIVFVSWPVN